MSADVREFVFGYGSLLERYSSKATQVCYLYGYRRGWNVAMDNSRLIPGYKYYVCPKTGVRPKLFVTFLNIYPQPSGRVNGLLVPTSGRELIELDRRERNYRRVNVSACISLPEAATVWTYVGTDEALERYAQGLASNRAAISRDYYDAVYRDFAALGYEALRELADLTNPPSCPILDLRRIDLPQLTSGEEKIVAS